MTLLTSPVEFASRAEVTNWIICHQLERRNLLDEQKAYMRGKQYINEKQSRGGDHRSKGHGDTLIDTADKLAAQYGVSPATIKRDGQFAQAVDIIADRFGDPKRREILSGKSGLSRKQVVAMADDALTLKIDPEFESLHPQYTDDQSWKLERLEASILRDGCYHSIKVWNGIIVDGHYRYRTCRKHGIPFKIDPLNCASRDEVIVFICDWELGQRRPSAELARLLRSKGLPRETES